MLAKALSLTFLLLSLGQMTLDACVSQTSLGGNLYLVNRSYRLAASYEPGDLLRPDVRCLYSGISLRREAAEALEELFAAAKDEGGHVLQLVSGYRSWGRQSAIYQRKIKATGSVLRAQLLVAPPGASEHQLGLAADISRKANTALSAEFGETPEGKWVSENAYRFGYIVRYKEEWTAVTGYAGEPWHIRYVGREHAAKINALHVPLETYVELLSMAVFGGYLKEGG